MILFEPWTHSEFLTRKEMENGAVVIVDEAGQIGAKQMLQVQSMKATDASQHVFANSP